MLHDSFRQLKQDMAGDLFVNYIVVGTHKTSLSCKTSVLAGRSRCKDRPCAPGYLGTTAFQIRD